MKLPLEWLKQYVDIRLPAEKLAELLTMSGTAVESIEKTGDGAVLNIEVTTNRPDCLSILGLAREVAALTGKKIKFPKIARLTAHRAAGGPRPVVKIEDPKTCGLYVARLIRNVSIGPAPGLYRKFLALVGVRAINNAVDATNFVLYEMGQPLHAFDYDKIRGGLIRVRRSGKGEKFLALDGNEYELDDRTLVIADAERPIALAGVIGGALTEVTASTRNILLESAYFNPRDVRRSSRHYKIFTESSYRFERGVDFEQVAPASRRAGNFITPWTGGRETASLEVRGSVGKTQKETVLLRAARAEKWLGLKIPPKRIRSILTALDFKVSPSGKDRFLVTAPGARRDILQEADLFEELLRIEGFEKVPAAIPLTRHLLKPVEDRKAVGVLELKKFISGLGFHEIASYSLLSGKSMRDSSFGELARAQKIINASSGEQEFFRPTLLAGSLQAVLFNVHRKIASLKLFEAGNCYLDGREETKLALTVYGNFEENWRRKSEAHFFDLKGAVENILGWARTGSYEWEEGSPWDYFSNAAVLKIGNQEAGSAGIIKKEVLEAWGIPRDVFFAEVLADPLFQNAGRRPVRVRPVPRFPSVRRDIAFIIDDSVPVRALESLMKKTAVPYLQTAELFDQYVGGPITSGKRSLAFSLAYQKETGTFTDEEINALQARVGEALKSQYRVEFR